MVKTTRQQILDLLAAREIATATEISQIIHITHANARHHLNNLESEGLIQVTGYRIPQASRGRPARQYQLTTSVNDHNLNQLADVLLNKLKTLIPNTDWLDLIGSLAEKLISNENSLDPNGSLSHKLNTSVSYLNTQHYRARWEAHTEAPRLILGHCPYKQIINHHPELCQLDASIIENFLGLPVEQVGKLEHTTQGLEICVFLVKK